MTLQQQACMRINNLSDEGAAFINHVLNSMNPNYFVRRTRNDREVKQLDVSRRIGIAEGMFKVPDDFDKYNDEIADMFEGVDK